MKIKMITIAPEVEAVLHQAILDDNKLILQGQLDRLMYTKVMKILEQIGFKWNKKEKCHIGEGDSADKLREALGSGKVVNEKQTYQFFETQEAEADNMVERAEILPNYRVLEPSAGRGAIIKAIYRKLGDNAPFRVHAVELDPHNVEVLKDMVHVIVYAHDFMEHPTTGYGYKYDRILMNPPFNGGQDVEHVRHAYEMLDNGGKIIAIMSTGWLTKSDKKSATFRRWFDDLSELGYAEVVEKIKSGAFKNSGTMVETLMVSIEKPPSSF